MKLLKMRKNFVNIIRKTFYSILIIIVILMLQYGLKISIIAKFNFFSIRQSSINISFRYDRINPIKIIANGENGLNKNFSPIFGYYNLTENFYVENFNIFIKDKLSSYMIFSNDFKVNSLTPSFSSKIKYKKTILNKKKLCPMIPSGLVGHFEINKTITSLEELENKYLDDDFYDNINGHLKPKYCNAHSKVAIIVPYRNRLEHLKVFLNNMHVFLRNQLIEYTIYVIEEVPNLPFNRALLMNIGYAEALKDYDFSCFVFHDVDLLPLDDRNFYYCPSYPRHMSVNINTFNYVLPYKEILGGVTAIKFIKDFIKGRNHFEKINGFSNLYFGWGGEDDDFSERVVANGLKIIRYPDYISRYFMLGHEKEKPSNERHRLLEEAKNRFKIDGLNSLKYRVLNKTQLSLYTLILVTFDIPAKSK